MDIWICFYKLHMANNILKWWKNKFFNGYKQFSVQENDDTILSDTEELLENLEYDKSRQATSTPINAQETTPISPLRFNLEEFTCGVSTENGTSAKVRKNQDKQEFSFTLYDFDGHGKVTKDDIAGLVTTIYDALGSSVKVPHYGSKTIKVKLTVSPDQTAPNNTTYKKDFNVTIKHDCAPESDAEESVDSVAADAAAKSLLKDLKLHQTKTKKKRQRSSSSQRKELLEIIQANMRKHKSLQTPRKTTHASQESPKQPPCEAKKTPTTPRVEKPPPAAAQPPYVRPTVSHHHIIKHKNRQEDQARAMAQVVRWLEQRDFTPKKAKNLRHEHHHVHEHHHYHHYQD